MSPKPGGTQLVYDEKLLDVAPEVTQGQRQVDFFLMYPQILSHIFDLKFRKATMQTSSIRLPHPPPARQLWFRTIMSELTSNRALRGLTNIWRRRDMILSAILLKSHSGKPPKA
jgi:hypothetical protein